MHPINLISLLFLAVCLFIIFEPSRIIKIFKPKIKEYNFNKDLIFKNKTLTKNKKLKVIEKKYKFGKVLKFQKKD